MKKKERNNTENEYKDEEEAKEHRKTNKRVQKAPKKAKEDWINTQCKVIDACLNKKLQ